MAFNLAGPETQDFESSNGGCVYPKKPLGQTPFMGWALKNGSFNTDTWSPDQLKKLKGDFGKQAKESAERYQAAKEKSDAEDS